GWLVNAKAGADGNQGARDEIAALQWVQRNIGAFGGDVKRVLLFGESAGAVEGCTMLVSPLAKGLFSPALMESGACTARAKTDAEAIGDSVAQRLGCAAVADVGACMRGKPAADVVTAVGEAASVSGKQPSFQPSVDGAVIPGVPLDLITQGK